MSEHIEHLVSGWIERNQPEGIPAPTITRTEAQDLHIELRVAASLLNTAVELRDFRTAMQCAQDASKLAAALATLSDY